MLLSLFVFFLPLFIKIKMNRSITEVRRSLFFCLFGRMNRCDCTRQHREWKPIHVWCQRFYDDDGLQWARSVTVAMQCWFPLLLVVLVSPRCYQLYPSNKALDTWPSLDEIDDRHTFETSFFVVNRFCPRAIFMMTSSLAHVKDTARTLKNS